MGNIGISGQSPLPQPGGRPAGPSVPAGSAKPAGATPGAAIAQDADKTTARGPKSGIALPKTADPESGSGASPLESNVDPQAGIKPSSPLEDAARLQTALGQLATEQARLTDQFKSLKPHELEKQQDLLLRMESLKTAQAQLEETKEGLMRKAERELNEIR